MKALLMLFFTILVVFADEPRYRPYISSIGGEPLASFPSHAFVRKGGNWEPGQPLKTSVGDIARKAKGALVEKTKRHDWHLSEIQFATFGEPDSGQWIVVVSFHETDPTGIDSVAVVSNLKGDIWPVGEVFDPPFGDEDAAE